MPKPTDAATVVDTSSEVDVPKLAIRLTAMAVVTAATIAATVFVTKRLEKSED